jgi:hypothetical protein
VTHTKKPDPAAIDFGLDEATDRASFCTFIQLIGNRELAEVLAARLSRDEIDNLVALLSDTMRTHLDRNEYHRLFLRTPHH